MKRAEKALFITYRHVIPRSPEHAAFYDCGAFLGPDWAEIASNNDILPVALPDAAREALAHRLADAILDLLPPAREVIYARAIGMSWRAVIEHLPRRAYHSIQEDWNSTLRWLAAEHTALTVELSK